ncbi:hypothetical protein IVB30_11070 [Bradyrhizobium sp. 200]|uniref:hypothetical protein n=1 Tax=Bradyrhizobium sp. 200 TaxID=2782665 RepID=UPI001FFE3B45|nr:hypothetical protein [Bradyrhizobium sp. 200]UPJ51831.1 hypothetical protein IVB30_11070 [Bradyrhizobium sp. 200]
MKRNTRNLSLAQHARLRNEAVRLKDDGLDYIQIGRELDVTTIAARDLCMQHQQFAKRQSGLSDVPRLPHRVIQLFLNGRYANLIGQTVSIRTRYLADIASLYSKSDLLCEQGIGRLTVARIEQRLAAQDRRFRAPDETLAEVICRFRPRPARSAMHRASRAMLQSEALLIDGIAGFEV